jgi:chromosome partitioning protein
VTEDDGNSWPAVDVEAFPPHSPGTGLPDDGIPSILELAGIDPYLEPAPEAADPVQNGADVQPADDTGDVLDSPGESQHLESPTVRDSADDLAADGAGPTVAPPAATDDEPDHAPNGYHPTDGERTAAAPATADDNGAAEALTTHPVAAPLEAPAGPSNHDATAAPRPDAAPSPEAAAAATPVPPAAPVRPPLPRIMAIANQKGGVGKTTTAVNLGASLAELGYRVLVVDLDPQGNATTGLGVNARNLQASIYDVLLADLPMEDCIEPTGVRNLFVAPATIDLAGAEIELVPAFSRELRLRRALESLGDEYDFVLIDCPPSLGLLTVNGLAAASEVVVPIQCEYYALEGLGQLMRNVQLVQRNLNPRLEMSTIILTMYDARTKLAEQVAKEVRRHFGPKVCRNIVPRTVRLSEAPSFGQPILVFDSTSRGALAYRELAKEVSGGAPQRTR